MAGEEKMEAPAVAASAGAAVGTTRIPNPMFSEENYCRFMGEIKEWKEVCGLPKTKQGVVLWLYLPRDTPSNIKESIKASVCVIKLKKEIGVKSSSTP